MFTSRAEYRILLRQDNADERLTPVGYEIGLVGEERMARLREKRELIKEIRELASSVKFKPDLINEYLLSKNTTGVKHGTKIETLASRPQLKLEELLKLDPGSAKYLKELGPRRNEVLESVEITIKYQGYIEREKNLADKIKKLYDLNIPEDVVYDELLSISTEGRQKLDKHRPETVGKASRLSGVSPSDISVLLMYMGR